MLPGISGALFPLRYLADPLARQASHLIDGERARRTQTQLTGWWRSVASSCGPATGVRAMFDLVAMPLASILGFRASDAVFDRQAARVRLITPSGATVGLLVLPWAARPSQIWRDAVRVASEAGGSWCFVVAPPFVSLLHATGRAARRAIDFTLPDVIHEASIRPLLMLCHAHAFDRSADGSVAAIDHLLASATSFQGRVREDLQAGVTAALTALTVPGLLAAHEAPNRFDEALTHPSFANESQNTRNSDEDQRCPGLCLFSRKKFRNPQGLHRRRHLRPRRLHPQRPRTFRSQLSHRPRHPLHHRP
jgi:hypothetical protein